MPFELLLERDPCLARGSTVNGGEGRRRWIWIYGKHAASSSLLLTLLSLGTEGQIAKSLQTHSQFTAVLLCAWLMLTLGFRAVRLSRKEIGMQFQTRVTGMGRGGRVVLMPKGPRGLPAMGFASLGVGVSWAISCLGLTVLISEWLVVSEKEMGEGSGEGER